MTQPRACALSTCTIGDAGGARRGREHNEVAQALYASLPGGRQPLGDDNNWWSLND
ncbi:MAG: hypothetical protein HRT86_13230 [Ilumatobacteraceae bacterium]|nr:hypothetical protein [Ilumatobacteraceae bacterium]